MGHRDAQRRYSEQALEAWFRRLSVDWERYFPETALQQGRRIYREGLVSQVELAEDHAIVHCRPLSEGGNDTYSIIDWPNRIPTFRNSAGDGWFGQAIAVAGMYEIEELVADEIPPIALTPGEGAGRDESAGSTGTDPADALPLAEVVAEAAADHEAEEPPRIHLAFHWRDGRLVFSPTIAAPGGGQRRVNAFAVATPPPVLREQLIRLSAMARRAGFRFETSSQTFYLAESERFHPFLAGARFEWARVFDIEMGPTVRQIARGIRTVRVVASLSEGGSVGRVRLSWRVLVGQDWLSDEEAARVLRSRESTVILRGRGALRLDPAQLRQVESLPRGDEAAVPVADVPAYMVYSLFDDSGVGLEWDAATSSWREGLGAAPQVPTGLPTFLRPYQIRGIAWLLHLCRHHCAPLLADDMGLGKTIQVLGFFDRLPNPENLPSLIICPASVVPVWIQEAARFFPQLRLETLSSVNPFRVTGEPVIWVSSFSKLRRNRAMLDEIDFNCAVVDEAQQIKNPEAKATRACYAIRARFRVALSGTPVENHQGDLWSIFRFLMPGLLGSRREFLSRFQADPEEATRRLRIQIAPFLLRRTKQKVANELPEKVENLAVCPLSDSQRRAYRELCERALDEFSEESGLLRGDRQIHFFALLTRLRQACCDSALLPAEYAPSEGRGATSGKLDTLLEKLEEVLHGNRKIVIFSQFVPFLDRIRGLLEERFPGVPVIELMGRTRDRAEPVETFQTTASRAVMLVSLKAGGAGITLHAADYVFLMDPWWNPAVENQAIDRVHRIGQKQTVFVYRMITEGTIEASIQELKERKTGVFDDLVGALESGAFSFPEQVVTLRNLIVNGSGGRVGDPSAGV